jgi:hypothetical protein
MKQKGFAQIIILILLIIVLAVVGYFAYKDFKSINQHVQPPSPTPSATLDLTADWKTYTNSTYKFLIKYPSNWISKSYTPTDSRIPYLYNPDNKYDIQFGYIKDEPNVISEMTGKPMVTDLSNYNLTTINGIKVYVNNNLQGNDGNYIKYYFQITDGEYISILVPLTNTLSNVVWDEATVSLAKQTLSTFKFTDQNQTLDTTNWKTYTNNYWGVSIKYPQDKLVPCPNYTTEAEGMRFFNFGFSCPNGTDIVYKIGLVGYKSGEYKENKKPTATEQITVDSKIATKKTYSYDESDGSLSIQKESQEVVIKLDKGTLVLQQWGDNSNDKQIFNQILSTFKFTQ